MTEEMSKLNELKAAKKGKEGEQKELNMKEMLLND